MAKLTESEEKAFQDCVKEYSTLIIQYDTRQIKQVDFMTRTDQVLDKYEKMGLGRAFFFRELEARGQERRIAKTRKSK